MSLIENLCHDYGDFEINIPYWELSDQGVTALWGPSGAGKTSVFRLLIGLEPCPGLKWNFQDIDLAQLPIGKKRLGVVFQSYELFPHMTAKENILFAAEARGIKNSMESLDELVKTLELEACLGTMASKLSGGEQQRTALARALIGQPRFLFLDEPFSSLDSQLKRRARELVKTAIHKRGVPTLLITHDEDDLSALTDRVVRMADGKIIGN